jgi:hypothetical protein
VLTVLTVLTPQSCFVASPPGGMKRSPIAAALAKAQAELSNPEKSLLGIIGASAPRNPGCANPNEIMSFYPR